MPLIPIFASGMFFLIKFMKSPTSAVIPFILRVNAPEGIWDIDVSTKSATSST